MIWLTADFHLNHANIINYSNRPFHNVEHMNAELVRRFNERVGAEDTIYHVGDESFNIWCVKQVLPLLNGKTHILVVGNHDRCHRCHKGFQKYIKVYLDCGFSEILQSANIDIGNETVHIDHFPYRDNSIFDHKYDQYRPIDYGQWLLHAHIHERWIQKGKMINVGVDARDYYPISVDEIAETIKLGPRDLFLNS